MKSKLIAVYLCMMKDEERLIIMINNNNKLFRHRHTSFAGTNVMFCVVM